MEEKVTEASLPEELAQISPKRALSSIDIAVAELELDYLEQALIQFNGNKSKAAEALNGRNTGQLHHLVKKYKERYPELIRQYSMIKYVYKIT